MTGGLPGLHRTRMDRYPTEKRCAIDCPRNSQADTENVAILRAGMELGEAAFPVTRTQLDIWLAQEARQSDAEWQLGLFVEIDGNLDRRALKWSINRAVAESEPLRVSFFEADGRVYQRPVDDVGRRSDGRGSAKNPPIPDCEALQMAQEIQRTPMPLDERLFTLHALPGRFGEELPLRVLSPHRRRRTCHRPGLPTHGRDLFGRRLRGAHLADRLRLAERPARIRNAATRIPMPTPPIGSTGARTCLEGHRSRPAPARQRDAGRAGSGARPYPAGSRDPRGGWSSLSRTPGTCRDRR